MKNTFSILMLVFSISSCDSKKEISSVHPVNWESKRISLNPNDSLVSGSTYLSIYSQIYSQSEQRTIDLTATVSMRNTSSTDTIYVEKAEYFNTKGKSIRTYFDQTIFIVPLQTVEIVIDETDEEGGTGANFVFDWKTKPNTSEPLFEGVMISTYSNLGLSFTTEGVKSK